jgi:environmental stress-induced protein Ves
MIVIPHATLPITRWQNGAGRKADIATGDGWMTGFAWLDAEAPFSDFGAQDRTITLVRGPGFTLTVAGQALPVMARFRPTPFDGGLPTLCQVAGPCLVLNVMTRRDTLRHSVTITGPQQFDPAGAVAMTLVLLRGEASVDGAALGPLDAVRVDGPVTVDGSADCLLACARIAVSSASGSGAG